MASNAKMRESNVNKIVSIISNPAQKIVDFDLSSIISHKQINLSVYTLLMNCSSIKLINEWRPHKLWAPVIEWGQNAFLVSAMLFCKLLFSKTVEILHLSCSPNHFREISSTAYECLNKSLCYLMPSSSSWMIYRWSSINSKDTFHSDALFCKETSAAKTT